MSKEKISDVNVTHFEPLETPEKLKNELPCTAEVASHVQRYRDEVRRAIHGQDQRLVVVIGPCSIHDPKAAYDYATRLAQLSKQVADKILIVMRVYFEKPRTTVGWKGLINDPHLDGSNDINRGLRLGREILLKINNMGLPCATEFLDPIVPQYTADLVVWAAIGARTTESQTHREMASGLSMPVGFKNATDGGLQVALDAMVSARHPHAFLGIDQKGTTAIVRTIGNKDVHLVLRGGGGQPNYSPAHIAFTKVSVNAPPNERLVMVDCSHGNSSKDFSRQPLVFNDLIQQVLKGERSILGMMLESFLLPGRQDISGKMEYGKSVTDGCIDWETTEKTILDAYHLLKK